MPEEGESKGNAEEAEFRGWLVAGLGSIRRRFEVEVWVIVRWMSEVGWKEMSEVDWKGMSEVDWSFELRASSFELRGSRVVLGTRWRFLVRTVTGSPTKPRGPSRVSVAYCCTADTRCECLNP